MGGSGHGVGRSPESSEDLLRFHGFGSMAMGCELGPAGVGALTEFGAPTRVKILYLGIPYFRFWTYCKSCLYSLAKPEAFRNKVSMESLRGL